MMDMSAVIQRMIVLFLLLIVGYFANKLGIMDAGFNKRFSGLIINISTPAMILHSVMNSEHLLGNGEVLLLLAIAVLAYAVIIALSFPITMLLGAAPADRRIYQFMLVFSNTGFMGYPVAQALLGSNAIFYVTIFGIPFNALVYSYGVYLASGGKTGRLNRKMLLSPCIIAALLAIVLYFIHPVFPGVIESTFGYLSDITVPGAMMIIGSSLAMIPLRSVFGDWRVYFLSAVKLLGIPVLAWAVMNLLPVSTLTRQLLVLMWALPVATNSTMLAVQYGGNESLASRGVLITTAMSLITIPLLMWLLPFR